MLGQIAAIRAALAQVGLIIVRSHTEHYVAEAIRREERGPVEDLMRALDRLLR